MTSITASYEKYFDENVDDYILCSKCDHLGGHHDGESCFICETCNERHEYFESPFNQKILICSECSSEWSLTDNPNDIIKEFKLIVNTSGSDGLVCWTKNTHCPNCNAFNSVSIHRQCSCDGDIYPSK